MPGEMAIVRLEIQVDRRGLRGFPGVAAVSGDAVGPVAEVSLVPEVDQGPIVVYAVRFGVGDAWGNLGGLAPFSDRARVFRYQVNTSGIAVAAK